MLPDPFIDRDVTRQSVVAFLGVLERHLLGPCSAKGLEAMPLCFAVGPGCVGLCADVFQAKGFAGLGQAA